MEPEPTNQYRDHDLPRPLLPPPGPEISTASPTSMLPPRHDPTFLTPHPPRSPKLIGRRYVQRLDSSLTIDDGSPRMAPYPNTNNNRRKNRIEPLQQTTAVCLSPDPVTLRSQEYNIGNSSPTII